MQWHSLMAFRATWMMAVVLSASAAGPAGSSAGCPPEEQAVLGAYAQCAAYQPEGASGERSATLEAHAARLFATCGTHASEYLGFDPFQELLDCAQAMAEAGEIARARSVEPVAQAYRAEQMRRLLMHGGQLLDPTRYMGRPPDYEYRSATIGPVEERITTAELSAAKPKGGGWKLLTSERQMPLVYWKDPAWLSTRPVKGQNVVVVLTTRGPGFARSIGAQAFPAALEKLLLGSAGKTARVVSISVKHSRQPEDYCADYVMTSEEESGNPDLPGIVLETAAKGFACLESSSRVVIQAYYEENRPRGAPSVLDDVVRGEAESFLQDVHFAPRR